MPTNEPPDRLVHVSVALREALETIRNQEAVPTGAASVIQESK